MAKKIKRFFVFLFFSLFFSLLSGRISVSGKKENGNKCECEVKNKSFSLNAATAGTCLPYDPPDPPDWQRPWDFIDA